MTPELRARITEAVNQIDDYLEPKNKFSFKFADIETLVEAAERESLEEWFADSYRIFKELLKEPE